MQIKVFSDKQSMGKQASADGAAVIREAISTRGEARIVVATGASQFEVLEHLVDEPDIAWDKVTGFHLDEYVGVELTHPASFRLYLWERFVRKLPLPLRAFHYIDGSDDAKQECQRVGKLIAAGPIDVAFVGIGENGHLAFNDPPADFETTEPYHVVNLNEACRKQQLGEGWFKTLDDVPKQAISMSVQQILKAGTLICAAPDERKSEAVRNTVEGPVTRDVPASIMHQHEQTTIYLDEPAASKLSPATRK